MSSFHWSVDVYIMKVVQLGQAVSYNNVMARIFFFFFHLKHNTLTVSRYLRLYPYIVHIIKTWIGKKKTR